MAVTLSHLDKPQPDRSRFINPWNHRGWIAYLTNLLPRFQYVRFVGYPSLKDTKNTRIERLYVPLDLSRKRVGPDQAQEAKRHPVHELLAEHGRLVVLGDPGSGKSTLISYLTTMLAARSPNVITRTFGNLIPLPLILRDYALGPNVTFDDLLEQFYRQRFWTSGLTGDDLRQVLRTGQALIMLDGLDEVGAISIREALRAAVWKACHEFPQCLWILTSRTVGYDAVRFDSFGLYESLPNLGIENWEVTQRGLPAGVRKNLPPEMTIATSAYLVPFSDQQIEQFAHNWYAEREAYQTETEAKEFVTAIRGNSTTLRLARTPNLLTMMALIYRVRARLPNGRAMLYDEIADAYLHTIEEERRLPTLPYPLAEKKRWLARVAFEMQSRRAQQTTESKEAVKEILVEQQQVTQWIAEAMQQSGYGGSPEQAAEFVDYIARRSGLLLPRGLDEQGRAQFAFAHLSFQEFFAACRLAEHITAPRWLAHGDQAAPPRPRDFADLARQDAWRETLFFLAELLANRPGWPQELATLLFGEGFQHIADGEEAARPAAVLLAMLATNPHSGFTDEERRRAIAACCRWEASEQKRLENAWYMHNNEVLRVLLACEPDAEWRQTLEMFLSIAAKLDLRALSFDGTPLRDLSPLAGMTGLTYLDLRGTSVSDLSPLAGMTGLTYLDLRGTSVSDLSPLAGMTKVWIILDETQQVKIPQEFDGRIHRR